MSGLWRELRDGPRIEFQGACRRSKKKLEVDNRRGMGAWCIANERVLTYDGAAGERMG